MLVGLAWGIIGYFGAWLLVIIVCVFDAAGQTAVLPGPGSWTMRGVMLLVAIGVAVVGWRRAALDTVAGLYVDVRGWLTASTALIFAITGITFVVGVAHDAKFLSELPAGTDRSQALVDGHRACHWLQAQPWGRPPGPNYLPGSSYWVQFLYRSPVRHSGGSRSAGRLMVRYIKHVEAMSPVPMRLSATEQSRVRFAALAWYDLCPFQLDVHHPDIGGGGGGAD